MMNATNKSVINYYSKSIIIPTRLGDKIKNKKEFG